MAALLLLSLLFTISSFPLVVNADLQDDFNLGLMDFARATVFSHDLCSIHVEVLRLNYPEEEIADYFCPEGIYAALDKLNTRRDTTDFELMAFSWLLNAFWDHPILSSPNHPTLKDDIVDALINLPMWLSDEGDLGPMQYWSENHIIGWRQAQYLIGNGFDSIPELRDVIFKPSGLTGAQLREVGREHVLRWLDYRSRFGFSEFNSDTYGEHSYDHMVPLCTLAPDEDIRTKARSIQTLLEFDQLLASRGNRIATARGRAYSEGMIGDQHYTHLNLLKGTGSVKVGEKATMYLVQNVLHGYVFPTALLEIGRQVEVGTHIMRERFGLPTEAGPAEGLGATDAEDCIFWLGDGAYVTPDIPYCMFVIGDAYDLWNRSGAWELISFAKPIYDENPEVIQQAANSALGYGPILGYANVYTMRTEDFMLSSAQDYHGGYAAGQQILWQATLNTYQNGTVFSHQPFFPKPHDDHNSLYWISGILPKVAQFGTTLIAMHNPELLTTLIFPANFTHAHFSTSNYDEVINEIGVVGGGWVFARKNDAYVALYTDHHAEFRAEELPDRDLVAPGVQNVYICEVGSLSLNNSFEEFTQNLRSSTIDVTYTYNDSLLECLVDNGCLETTGTLLVCMGTVCAAANGHQDSETQDCLRESAALPQSEMDKFSSELSMWNILHGDPNYELPISSYSLSELLVMKCIQSKRAQLELVYSRGDGVNIAMNWDGGLMVDDYQVPLSDYPRYDNAYAQVAWGNKVMQIRSDSHYVNIDFDAGTLDYD